MGMGYDPTEVVAYGVVNGGVSPTFDKQYGIDAAITRVSAGVYNIVLSGGGIDEQDCIESGMTRFTAVPSSISVVHVDDTTKQFKLTSTGVAADGDFSFILRRAEI